MGVGVYAYMGLVDLSANPMCGTFGPVPQRVSSLTATVATATVQCTV